MGGQGGLGEREGFVGVEWEIYTVWGARGGIVVDENEDGNMVYSRERRQRRRENQKVVEVLIVISDENSKYNLG